MKIKNTEELANVLGMAFRQYSATVATGREIDEFTPLLEGQETMNAVITLNSDGSISIKRWEKVIEEVYAGVDFPTEVPDETPITEVITEDTPIVEPVLEAPAEETVEEKPKRKRRTI